ncbi:MAG: actin-binding WH2 domain-containing protein [Chloroflexi bacterium]|nr:actin-binding WH2 domain-containing protein [Chloroflexota bacterium]
MNKIFTIIPQFLQNPQEFYESIQRGEKLKQKAISLFLSTLVFLLIYGFATGLSRSWQQAFSTALKMPILFLLTLAFTLPALYFFALALLNIRFSAMQAGIVILSGVGVTAFLLLGLAPVTLFFSATSSNYPFFQLLAVVFVAISGLVGLFYILRGISSVDKKNELQNGSIGSILLRAWVFLYAFVGAQMTWRLSPFIGNPKDEFEFIRPSRDNFFVDVLNAFQEAFGLSIDRAGFDMIGIYFCGGIIVIFALMIGFFVGARKKSKTSVKVENS